jgi:UDP-N-acetyl-D-glucosamine dehydrogenase
MVAKADCVVVVTDHTCIDYSAVADAADLIVDTRNAFKGIAGDHIVRL